jgi:hypothetical protein
MINLPRALGVTTMFHIRFEVLKALDDYILTL